MLLEKGGRADKAGNRYEIKCIICELLKVVDEKTYSVTIEPIGDDENGTDILVVGKDNAKEYIQCKASNGEKGSWSIVDLKNRAILRNWATHLRRDELVNVSLMSPYVSPIMESLIDRAKNTGCSPEAFYHYQICANKNLRNEYKIICDELNLLIDEKEGRYQEIEKSIDFLRRIAIKTIPPFDLSEQINNKIEFLFITECKMVYDSLISYIVDGDILGKEITIVKLKKFFEEHGIRLRSIEGDGREYQHLLEINKEYNEEFRLINDKLIHRKEFDQCIELIKHEKSFVISGGAGTGKSGCTKAITNYCEEHTIPYIALKLDRKTPNKCCDIWSHDMAFSNSFIYVLHMLSRNEKAVIILDQLDALRWTNSNSVQALDVCMDLIRKVESINEGRDHKISIVFVCRKYDLENDNNINRLFETKQNETENEWRKIVVGEFDDVVVKDVVGEYYGAMSKKLKELLRIPSNLYIWEKIDNKNQLNGCATNGQLIDKWYKQIYTEHSDTASERDIVDAINGLVDKLEKKSKLYLPSTVIQRELPVYEYLLSSGLLVEDDKKIGFVHQSIFDYFIAKKMNNQLYEGASVEEIIGSKETQTPKRRYQIQMFLQNIYESDIDDFLHTGETILKSENIRYYIKFLIFEYIGQIENPNNAVCDFVIRQVTQPKRVTCWINNVLSGRKQYVSILVKNGIMAQWFENEETKKIVFQLLHSIGDTLSVEEVRFIEDRSFINEEDDRKFAGVLWHRISEDTDELFEYRIKLYSRYPDLMQNVYTQLNEEMPLYEKRIIRIISLFYENKNKAMKPHMSGIDDIIEGNKYEIDDGEYVIDHLLKHIPKEFKVSEERNSDWCACFFPKRGIERLIMMLLKKANQAIIRNNPDRFWEYYDEYLGKRNLLFDELILHGLAWISTQYSDKIMLYIAQDFDNNIYDRTSGEDDELKYVKEAVRIHAKCCSDETFIVFEKQLLHYTPKKAVDLLKRRIEFNKTGNRGRAYWSFWGDLQYELLQVLPYERLSKDGKDLLIVLSRKYRGQRSSYLKETGHGGWIASPVSGKKLGKKEWWRIINNKKIIDRKLPKWIETKGGFIESSIETYTSDFHSVVSNNPEEMIKYVLNRGGQIHESFVDVMYSGIAYSPKINEVRQETCERLFKKYPCNMESERASYFCEIISKKSKIDWSNFVYEKLIEIVADHKGNIEDYKEKNPDSQKLWISSMNCVKGHAAKAIQSLLRERPDLLELFTKSIKMLSSDLDPTVKMASLLPLMTVYDTNRQWAQDTLMELYEKDVRFIVFQNSKAMLLDLYNSYGSRVIHILKKGFESDDELVARIAGYCVCELYIRNQEFNNLVDHIESLGENQVKYISEMAVTYLESEPYRQEAKKLILRLTNSGFDLSDEFSRVFYDNMVDLEKDEEFIKELISSRVGRKVIRAFASFIKKSIYPIRKYGEIIISLCKELVLDDSIVKGRRGEAEDISRLILSLYDECAYVENPIDHKYAEECLDYWDVMFEKQIGYTRELSRQLMER